MYVCMYVCMYACIYIYIYIYIYSDWSQTESLQEVPVNDVFSQISLGRSFHVLFRSGSRFDLCELRSGAGGPSQIAI